MSETSPDRWRSTVFEPERHHVDWQRLAGLLGAESRLGATLRRVADIRVPLLITGPPGRGKRWTARTAHALGERTPLLEVERAGGPGSRSLRRTFDGERGPALVVTGVEGACTRSQLEIADLIDDGVSVTVLGESEPAEAVGRGALRRELADRMLWLEVEPLSRRREDIETGLMLFLEREASRTGREAPRLHDVARARLCGYRWPGDVAELERFAERAVALGSCEKALAMVDAEAGLGADTEDLWDSACRRLLEGRSVSLERIRRRLVRQAERAWVDRVLHEVRGDTRRAAELLGVSPGRIQLPDPGGRP